VHQVGLVEEVAVELAVDRVLHQHLAGLADAGQQLVRALRGEDQLVLRPRALLAHRVEAAVELVEGRVRQPGLVEVQRVDVAVERVLDGLGVVEHAVVGALRQRQDARLDLAASTPASSGLAAILRRMASGENSPAGSAR
jgi:hypothetical protein